MNPPRGWSSIEATILDQDGTLYPNSSLLAQTLRTFTKNWLQRELRRDAHSIERIYETLKRDFPNPFLGFESLGLTIADYHKHTFEQVAPASWIDPDPAVVETLERLPGPRFVVTMASPAYSQRLQEHLQIRQLFERTCYVAEYPPPYDKAACYGDIIHALGVPPERVCVIGDNLSLDIIPAIRLGCRAIHIGSPGAMAPCESVERLPAVLEMW